MRYRIRTVAIACLVVAIAGTSAAQESKDSRLTIGVAASALPVMQELARRFTESAHHPVEIVFSPGATGLIARQLREGAPFDLFISADMKTPADLERKGVLTSGSVKAYARGQLVVWQPEARSGSGLRAARDLLDTSNLRMRIGIANPETAPYGLAARQALEAAGVWKAIQPRLVIADNAIQAHQFASSGNVDCALLPASLVTSTTEGTRFPVPQADYEPLIHGIGCVQNSANQRIALRFYEFVLSGKQAHVFREFGYLPPN